MRKLNDRTIAIIGIVVCLIAMVLTYIFQDKLPYIDGNLAVSKINAGLSAVGLGK